MQSVVDVLLLTRHSMAPRHVIMPVGFTNTPGDVKYFERLPIHSEISNTLGDSQYFWRFPLLLEIPNLRRFPIL